MADTIAIDNYLEGQGIKRSNLGYRYLTTAILLAKESHLMNIAITDMYEKIAEEYSTKALSVERAIRYSLLNKDVTNKKFVIQAIDDLNLM